MTDKEFKEKFAIFILSHGRANEILTVKTLKKLHYTGDYYVVIDNEDDQEEIYRKKFGDKIIQFDKKAEADKTDTGDLDNDRRVGVFARNAIQDIADKMGYKYHLQLDDDFSTFTFRYPDGEKLGSCVVKNLDFILKAVVEFFEETNIDALSFSLPADFMGGIESPKLKAGLYPKTMGTFFMKQNKKRYFKMRMNDDITTCLLNNRIGNLFLTIAQIMVDTPGTQDMSGGMTDIYVENGTYRKSFYSVMCCPSFVKIYAFGNRTGTRLHHQIKWDYANPKIISEKYKK